ncbi:MAG: dienelactone hydrolase family protein, partial [Rhodospirillales bacterium]
MSVIKSLGFLAVTFIALTSVATAEVIYHKKWYPKGDGPFPAVIVLHTAGGFKRIGHLPQRYANAGYAVYAPDYYRKYGIKAQTRMTGFKEHREEIQKDLEKLVSLIKK